jgi:hypothetical protein
MLGDPFLHRFLVRLGGDDHEQSVDANVAAGFRSRRHQSLVVRSEGLGRVDALAEAEGVVGILGGEGEAFVRGSGADDLHLALGQRPDPAILHLIIFALEVRDSGRPQLAQDVGVFAEHLVAVAEMLVPRPQPHLAVFGTLPAGDQVEAEAAVADRVDRVAHPRAEGGRDDEGRAGGVDLDLLGYGGEAGHQSEALQIIFPEFGLAAEAPQFDHREQEIDAVALGFLGDFLVEVEARHVLRGVFRDQPAVVADRGEDADFHGSAP